MVNHGPPTGRHGSAEGTWQLYANGEANVSFGAERPIAAGQRSVSRQSARKQPAGIAQEGFLPVLDADSGQPGQLQPLGLGPGGPRNASFMSAKSLKLALSSPSKSASGFQLG